MIVPHDFKGIFQELLFGMAMGSAGDSEIICFWISEQDLNSGRNQGVKRGKGEREEQKDCL